MSVVRSWLKFGPRLGPEWLQRHLPNVSSSEGGGGGDLLNLICPELGVAPLVDPGTDCKDELPTPAGPPAVIDQEMDSELQKVFIDVVSLPTMVTPVSDMDGTLRMPQAECPVVAPPAGPAFVIRPSLTPSSAGPKLVSPIVFSPPPALVVISPVPRTSPLVAITSEHTDILDYHGNLHHTISEVAQKATLTPTIKRETVYTKKCHITPPPQHKRALKQVTIPKYTLNNVTGASTHRGSPLRN